MRRACGLGVQTKFVPFNPVDKYTINHVKVKADGDAAVGMRIMKGAPQVQTLPTPKQNILIILLFTPGFKTSLRIPSQ